MNVRPQNGTGPTGKDGIGRGNGWLCCCGLKGDAVLIELLESIGQRIKPELRLGCEVNAGPFLRWKGWALALYILAQGAFLAADVPNPTKS